MKLIKRVDLLGEEVEEGVLFDALVIEVNAKEAERLRGLHDFINAPLYAGAVTLLPREIGRYDVCRIVLAESEDLEKMALDRLKRALSPAKKRRR